MRINPTHWLRRNRRGSLALEAIMVIPVMIVMILLTKFILEAMLTRHETAVYTRGSLVRAAEMTGTSQGSRILLNGKCRHDKSDISKRHGIVRQVNSLCNWRLGEKALPEQRRLGTEIRNAANYDDILKSFHFRQHPNDIVAQGWGSVQFTTPPFLSSTSGDRTGNRQVRPTSDFWSYENHSKWANGHDKAMWHELRHPLGSGLSGPRALFPHVFPSKGR